MRRSTAAAQLILLKVWERSHTHCHFLPRGNGYLWWKCHKECILDTLGHPQIQVLLKPAAKTQYAWQTTQENMLLTVNFPAASLVYPSLVSPYSRLTAPKAKQNFSGRLPWIRKPQEVPLRRRGSLRVTSNRLFTQRAACFSLLFLIPPLFPPWSLSALRLSLLL